MNKTMKKLVVILAAGMMFAAGSAYAGVNGCFQFYKQTADFNTLNTAAIITSVDGTNAGLPTDTVLKYAGADCAGFGFSANGVTPGQTFTSVAYELTQSYNVDLANINGGGQNESVMYVSTTDIPGASRLTFTLANALWQDAVMYLLKWNNTTQAWDSIAATDNVVAGQSNATFLFQSGITVQAGTKLFLSKDQGANAGSGAASFTPPKLKIANTDCKPSNNVTLNVTSALTDGKQSIYGALTPVSSKQDNILVKTPLQFSIKMPANPTTSEVNVEPPSLRTNFVIQEANSATIADAANATFTTAKIVYNNSEANTLTLDNQVTLVNSDVVNTKVYADKAVDSFMKVKQYAFGQYTIHNGTPDTLGTAVTTAVNSTTMDIAASLATATIYNIKATDLFYNTNTGNTVNSDVFTILTTTDATKVMPYNYKVNINQTLDFSTATYLDNCTVDQTVFSVGINGAVFKVSYIYADSNTFIRASNEDTTDALIFGDFFEGGLECTNVALGTVGAKASNLMKGDALVTAISTAAGANCAALATGIVNNNNSRFFGTFTVTAPKDKVHAYGIQKIPGGTDRVLTVLDQNSWIQ